MKKLFRRGVLCLLLSFALLGALWSGHARASDTKYAGKKVLYINSYQKGYEWSDGIEKGITSVLASSGAELRIQYMDTKNNQDEDFKKKAGLEAKTVIDTWKPDVVIVSDDNAVRYVLVPYFKNTKIPFVFNGVNWDAEQYGLPCSNATGMIEVDSADQMIKMLKGLKPDLTRVAVLAANTETEKQEISSLQKIFGVNYVETRYVSTFDDWKKSFVEMQDKTDILQLQNDAGIKGWNDDEAKAFALAHTKIPTGSIDIWMSQFAMVIYAKIPEEQGEWAAQTTLDILGGKSPADIPLARNVKGQIFVNAPLVRKLGLTIPQGVLAVANIIK